MLTAEQRELVMARLHAVGKEFWSWATRENGDLTVGQDVHVQTQAGIDKEKWRTTGKMVELFGHEQTESMET